MADTHASLKRRLVVACSTAAVIASLGAGAVMAGEITGNGKSLKLDDPGKWGTWLHARSECAYSGLNDTPGQDGFGHTQSWGQLPKEMKEFLTSIGVSPGTSCNPTRAGGGEP